MEEKSNDSYMKQLKIGAIRSLSNMKKRSMKRRVFQQVSKVSPSVGISWLAKYLLQHSKTLGSQITDFVTTSRIMVQGVKSCVKAIEARVGGGTIFAVFPCATAWR